MGGPRAGSKSAFTALLSTMPSHDDVRNEPGSRKQSPPARHRLSSAHLIRSGRARELVGRGMGAAERAGHKLTCFPARPVTSGRHLSGLDGRCGRRNKPPSARGGESRSIPNFSRRGTRRPASRFATPRALAPRAHFAFHDHHCHPRLHAEDPCFIRLGRGPGCRNVDTCVCRSMDPRDKPEDDTGRRRVRRASRRGVPRPSQ